MNNTPTDTIEQWVADVQTGGPIQSPFQVPEPEPEYHFVPNIDPDVLIAELDKLQRYQNGTRNDKLKPGQGQLLSKAVYKLVRRLAQPLD